MTEFFDAHRPATAFDHDSTLVVAMELSGKSWQLGAVIPGVSRRPKTGVKARDMNEVMRVVDRWKAEAVRAGKPIARIVVAYEAGRDGFWIARELSSRGIEAHVMQPASIPVERKGRRAKTDRIDLDMLLRTLLAWLRGEPRVCTMVRVPSVEEEDARRPGRERDKLVRERVGLENQIQREEGWFPLLIRADRRLAGFAVVSPWSALDRPLDRSVAEFFVLRKYRRARVGMRAGKLIFERFPGRWEVPVASYNRPALPFWRKTVRVSIGRDAEEFAGDGERWNGPVLCFEAGGHTPRRS